MTKECNLNNAAAASPAEPPFRLMAVSNLLTHPTAFVRLSFKNWDGAWKEMVVPAKTLHNYKLLDELLAENGYAGDVERKDLMSLMRYIRAIFAKPLERDKITYF